MRNKTTTGTFGSAERRWGEAEARAALDELGQSRESRFAFARRKGVSPQRVIYWQKKLGGAGRSTPAFVPVALPARDVGGAQIEIRLGTISVVVREDADVEYVGRLVAMLSRTALSC